MSPRNASHRWLAFHGLIDSPNSPIHPPLLPTPPFSHPSTHPFKRATYDVTVAVKKYAQIQQF